MEFELCWIGVSSILNQKSDSLGFKLRSDPKRSDQRIEERSQSQIRISSHQLNENGVETIVFSCFQHEVVVSEGDSSRILGIQGSFMFTSAKWLWYLSGSSSAWTKAVLISDENIRASYTLRRAQECNVLDLRLKEEFFFFLIFWENFDYQSLFWKESSSLRYTQHEVCQFLPLLWQGGWRYSIWLDRQPNKGAFLMQEKNSPWGELLSRDCLKRLLVLKQLCNLMKDYEGACKPWWTGRRHARCRNYDSSSD